MTGHKNLKLVASNDDISTPPDDLPRPSDANDDEDGSKLMVDSSGSGKVGNQFQDLVSAALAQVNF